MLTTPPTRFPAGSATGPELAPGRHRITHPLPPGVAATVAKNAAEWAAPPETVLATAVLVALARFTARPELLVGWHRADLTFPETRWLRATCDPDVGFRSLVADLIGALAAAVPVVDDDRPPVLLRVRRPGDVLLTDGREAGEIVVELSAADGRLGAVFDPDRYETVAVAGLLACAVAVLEAGGAVPDSPLWTMMEIGADERERVVDRPNATDRPVVPATLTELFDAAANRFADRPALGDATGELTYRALATQARRLGGCLGPLRVEDRVAVLVSRGDRRWVVACLAVLYAGGAFVPLDPDLPAERVDALLRRAGACAVVTDARLGASIAAGPWRVVDLDADSLAAVVPVIDGPVTPRSTAYCIFTSGSSGVPRGVLVEHASVVNFVASLRRLFAVTPDDRLLQYASPGFDVSVFEIFLPLLSGASLWVVGDGERLSIEGLSHALERWHITVAELPPVLMDAMVPERFPALRLVSVGGEPFPGAVVERWSVGRRVVNGYGPTEATIGVIYHECTGKIRTPPPIGLPVDNHRAYLLDDRLRPVPFGAIGELYLGGAGLARGYLGDPGLTATWFVADPFSRGGGRLYRTGDLARYNAVGRLLFVGRRDRQVKVRGQRVELGEVEAALSAHPDVRSAVVTAAESGLTGYVVGAGLDVTELRAYLTARLPRYLVPGRLVEIAAIPLTPSGKVDVAALAQGATDAPRPGPANEVTLSPLQRRLHAECLVRVLPGAPADPDADFFAAGGDSMQLIRLLALVHRIFGVEPSVLDFLRTPTLATLSRLVKVGAGGEAAPRSIPRAPDGVELPLSPAQQGIWFVDQLAPEHTAYNVVEAYRLRGSVDPARLRTAWQMLIRRHEALSLRVRVRDGVPYQEIDEGEIDGRGGLDWTDVDLTATVAADREAEAQAVLDELAGRPFDLACGRPLRIALICLAVDEYWLCVVMHHLVSDGRSTEILFDELSTVYAGGTLPPMPVRYRDVAWWQRERLDPDARRRHVAYWRDRLAGAPPEADLPYDRPRPAVFSQRGASVHFGLDDSLAEAAAEFARFAGTTLFCTFLAGFAALLARYARNPDVVVGTPVADRTRDVLDGVVGFLANTLVLRVDCGGDPTFAELVARARNTVLAVFAHQELPFERLVDELEPQRDLSRNPLFQILFQMYDAPGSRLRLPGVTAAPVAPDGRTSQFDLSVVIQVTPAGLAGSMTYSTDLFEAETIRRLADHYRSLLTDALADPQRRLSAIDFLTPPERELLARSAGVADTGPARTLNLVEAQVARTPNAVAVSFGAGELTYFALNAAANRLAARLTARGVRQESLVAVCLERDPRLVVALLAIVKAGAAYLPLDPAYPAERLRLILNDSGVLGSPSATLLTQRSLADRLPVGDHIVLLDDVAAEAVGRGPAADVAGSAQPAPNPDVRLSPDNLMYVIYTSGSTGQPKGVAVTHRSVTRLLFGLPDLEMTGDDTFLMLASVAFDVSTFEIWAPLVRGGRLAVYPPGRIDPRQLGEVLARERVTVLWLTAQLTNLVTDTAPEALVPPRVLITGGEALSAPHLRKLHAVAPLLRLVNGYGPTECATFATSHPVTEADLAGHAESVPIGRPIGDTLTYVLDADLNRVPPGVLGELYLGGAGVARGYLSRPDLTATRFVPDPFGAPGTRLYRTGDLVRLRADGVLEFAGRTDDQIKLRGFRIEPGEIAATLTRHPDVRDAFVTSVGEGFAAELAAYVVAAPGIDGDTLRAYLGELLPQYMVPSAYVLMDALPLSAHGKVDRRALPDPVAAAAVRRRAGGATPHGVRGAPHEGVATAVTEVWAEVLGRDDIGVDDDFFWLGGNSLRATQVAARLTARLGVDVPQVAVFWHPTVDELARELSRAGQQARPLRHGRESGPVVLSPAQRRLWFLDELRPGRATYNIAMALRLRGRLSAGAVRAALSAVVARHEPLRFRFTLPRGADWPVAEPLPVTAFTVGQCEAADADEAWRIAEQEAVTPFDLTAGPLIRATVVREGPADHLLVLVVHHAAFDGASTGVLLAELASGYRSEPALPALDYQYGDYAVAERERYSSSDLEPQVAYWRRQLAGLRPVELPTGRPRPTEPVDGPGGRYTFDLLPTATAERLSALAGAHGASDFMAWYAGFAMTLAVAAGQTDIALGTPVAGRDRPELEPLIGFFVNTVVLRVDLADDPDYLTALARTRDAAVDAWSHQDVPFDRLVADLNPPRRPNRTPWFEIIFSTEDHRGRVVDLPGLATEVLDVPTHTAKFDLDVVVARHAGGVRGTVEYRADVYREDEVASLVALYRRVLITATEQPNTPLSGFDRDIGERTATA